MGWLERDLCQGMAAVFGLCLVLQKVWRRMNCHASLKTFARAWHKSRAIPRTCWRLAPAAVHMLKTCASGSRNGFFVILQFVLNIDVMKKTVLVALIACGTLSQGFAQYDQDYAREFKPFKVGIGIGYAVPGAGDGAVFAAAGGADDVVSAPAGQFDARNCRELALSDENARPSLGLGGAGFLTLCSIQSLTRYVVRNKST